MRLKKMMFLLIGFILMGTIGSCGLKEDKTFKEEPLVEAFSIDAETIEMEDSKPIFTSSPLEEEVVERIKGVSYKKNPNISLEDLAYLQISHWGFDEEYHIGEMIVNKKVADQVLEIFRDLYESKFPIEKIRLIDDYGGDDDLSMLDNNTSAFNYREISGSEKISNHGYGIAIDINPVQNPYIKDGLVLPKNGEDYLDRENIRKGMIVKGDSTYQAFKKGGWTWGGDWNSLKDYQHFEFKLE